MLKGCCFLETTVANFCEKKMMWEKYPCLLSIHYNFLEHHVYPSLRILPIYTPSPFSHRSKIPLLPSLASSIFHPFSSSSPHSLFLLYHSTAFNHGIISGLGQGYAIIPPCHRSNLLIQSIHISNFISFLCHSRSWREEAQAE